MKQKPRSLYDVGSGRTGVTMSPPYQIGVFPTYLIISPEGTLVTAEQGDQGFARLRKDLERAGMNIE